MKSKKILLVAVNVVICLSYGFFVLMFNQLATPFIRGYYCNDESISKPFKESSISSTNVVIISCILGLICFIYSDIHNFMLAQSNDSSSFCLRLKRNKKTFLRNLLVNVLIYALGMGLNMFITDIHFYDVCKPNWSMMNCTNSDNMNTFFIGDQHCTNKDNSWRFKDARLSFPSGHSSYSGLHIFP